MTDPSPNLDLAQRFAELVALVKAQPTVAGAQRDAAQAVIEAAKAGEVRLALVDGVLVADDAPFDSPLLASSFAVYGLDELTLTARAMPADLLDLARMLAAAPGQGDQVARFAARQAVIDAKALPRRLRPRSEADSPAQSAPPPNVPSKSAPAPSRRLTPLESPAVTAAPPSKARDVPERLLVPVAMPDATDPALAQAREAVDLAETPKQLAVALERLTLLCDLAFRNGRNEDLIESLTTFVALEARLLERDSSDVRRQALNHALRTLAKPVLLRQLAILRHTSVADPVAVERLQQVLYRFGVDGAEAVFDEFVSAQTEVARETCLECLRGLRRTYDALAAWCADPRGSFASPAAQVLAALDDVRAHELLLELLQHPEPRARRAAIAALSGSTRADALEALVGMLDDPASLVRLRAVAALAGRRVGDALRSLVALIARESDREVLYSAIAALGTIGSAEAVQALIPIAEGEGANPAKRSAGMRIQACTALAIIRAPAAMAAVQALRADRDRDVREASVRLVAQAQRRTSTTGVPLVNGP